MKWGIHATKLDAPHWGIYSTYFSRNLVTHCKSVPGMRFYKDYKSSDGRYSNVWVGYPDAVAAVVARLNSENIKVEWDHAKPFPESWRDSRTPYVFAVKDLRPYQVDGVRFLLARSREGALLADAMRLGKALAADEPVLTPTGWRSIGELQIGDEVIGADGRPTTVTGVYPQGRKAVFEVTLTDGARTRCCEDHLWQVQTPSGRYRGAPSKVLALKEIIAQGLFQAGTSNRRWFVPVVQAVEFDNPMADLRVDSYLLGALLANGLTGTYSETKFVPKDYLLASKGDRLALLQGLFDNDGTVSADGLTVEYNTVSPRLAEDVLFLVRSLGGTAWLSTRIPTYVYKGERRSGQKDHRIRVSLPADIVPFRLPRKVARFKPRTKFPPGHAFDRVRPVGHAECVCISVEASDGLFVTRDFIVTHNSRQAITAARAWKEKTLVLCPPHVMGVWARPAEDPAGPGEVAIGWPAARVQQLVGIKASPIEDADVVVCHHDLVYAWEEELLKWGTEGGFTFILDEIHLIVGYTSRRSKAIKNLRAAATRAIGLTGTPLSNNPRKFHNVLDILSPGRFGPFFIPPEPEEPLRPTYAVIFCNSQQETVGQGEGQKTVWKHDGAQNLDEPDGTLTLTHEETLAARIQHMMLRRLKKDVDPELPQKQRQIIDVVVPAKAMIGVSESHLGGGGEGLRKCLDLAADAKLKSVVELVSNHLLEGEKVLCFCYRRQFAERVLSDVMRKVRGATGDARGEFVHGGVSSLRERENRIAALKNHKGPGLLACTIDTTSTGIDLSFATVSVFAEFTWEPHELQQAEERPYAYGKNKKYLVQYVIARGTGDELIVRAVVNKLDTFEKVIGATGDGMKQDLEGKKKGGLKNLFAALQEMQKAPDATVRRKRK